MGIVQLVIGAAVLLVLAALIDVLLSARTIVALLRRQEQLIESAIHFFTFEYHSYPYTHHMHDGGFCIWVFRHGSWVLSDDFSRAGFEPGPPPSQPGSYENEAVRKPSVKKQAEPHLVR